MRFSQRIAVVVIASSVGLVFLMALGNFLLLWFGKPAMTQETIQAISVYGGITASISTIVYGALSGLRDHGQIPPQETAKPKGDSSNG